MGESMKDCNGVKKDQHLESEDDIVGKKFEELSEDVMKNIQGSGDDIMPEDIAKSISLITSMAPYNCRG